jgi:DNA polymerase III delta subunit
LKATKKNLTFKEALSKIDKSNLIITFGDDLFYREQIRNKVISIYPEYLVVKIDAEGTDYLEKLLFKDLFGTKRIFIIENFNKIDNLNFFVETDFEDVVILDAEKISQSKTIKLVGKALFIELKKPSPWEEEDNILGKIKGFFKNKNYEIEDSIAKYLYNHIGYNLYKLSNELLKISLYKDSGTTITKNDIDAVGITNTKFNIFDLMNYMISGNKKEALALLDKVFEYESSPSILLISLWVSHFEKLLYIKTTTKQISDISEFLKVHTFVIEKKLKPQANNLSVDKLLKSIEKLLNIELQIKKNSFNLKYYFEKFILDF